MNDESIWKLSAGLSDHGSLDFHISDIAVYDSAHLRGNRGKKKKGDAAGQPVAYSCFPDNVRGMCAAGILWSKGFQGILKNSVWNPDHYVDQQYLPDEIKDARFYEPGDLGYEKQIKERLQKLREQ